MPDHSTNPYFYGPPASKEIGFYDRDDVFGFINDTLSSTQQSVIILYGQRRIGKTSILQQISRHLWHPERYHVVFFDLQSRSQGSTTDMLYGLAYEIALSLRWPRPDRNQFVEDMAFLENEFLPSVYAYLGDRRLVLTIDEFDVLAEHRSVPDQDAHPFVRYIDRITQSERHQDHIAFVFAVGRTVKDVNSLLRVFRVATVQQVDFLPHDYAVQLIVEPARPILIFEDHAIEYILSLTGKHPYYIQLLCHHIFNYVTHQEQNRVTRDDVQAIIDESLERAVYALSWFWDDVQAVERFILWALTTLSGLDKSASLQDLVDARDSAAIMIDEIELRNMCERLVERQVLFRDEQYRYRFTVELVRRWIAKRHTLDEIKQDPVFINPQAKALLEAGLESEGDNHLEIAIEIYRRARNAAPNYVDAYLCLGRALVKQNDLEQAIGEFESAHRFGSPKARDELVGARQQYARRLEETGNINDAIQEYERILTIEPSHEQAHYSLAAIHDARGNDALLNDDPAGAAEAYAKALKHDPESRPKIRTRLDEYKEKQEKGDVWNKAEEAMVAAVRLFPDEIGAHQALVVTRQKQIEHHLSKDDVDSAQCAGQRALEDCHTDLRAGLIDRLKLLFNQYRHRQEGQTLWAQAEQALRVLVALLPDDRLVKEWLVETLTCQGDAYHRAGKMSQARSTYGAAADVKGQLEEAKAMLLLKTAQAYLAEHEIKAAEGACWHALKEGNFADQWNIGETIRHFNLYSEACERKNDWSHAVQARQALVNLLSNEPGLQQGLVETSLKQIQFHLDQGQIEQAQQAGQLLLSSPQRSEILIDRVKLHFNQQRLGRAVKGQWDLAEASARALWGLLPDDQDTRRWLADFCIDRSRAYLAENQIEEAIRVCGLALDCTADLTSTVDTILSVFQVYTAVREKELDWVQAEYAMRALSRLLPKNQSVGRCLVETLVRRGDAYLKDDLDRAREAYDAAIQVNQGLGEPQAPLLLKQAYIFLLADDLGMARSMCASALAEDQTRNEIVEQVEALFVQYCQEQEQKQTWEQAERAMQYLVGLRPNQEGLSHRLAQTRLNQAQFYLERDHVDQAREVCRRALQDATDRSNLATQIKQVFEQYCYRRQQLGGLSLAQRATESLHRLFPQDKATSRILASLYVQYISFYLVDDDIDKASHVSDLALDCAPDKAQTEHLIKHIFLKYCRRQEQKQDWQRAEQSMRALVTLLDNDFHAQYWLACTQRAQGDLYLEERIADPHQAYDRAVSTWQRLHEQHPNNAVVRKQLALTLIAQAQVHFSAEEIVDAHIVAAYEVCHQALDACPGDLDVMEEIKELFLQRARDQETQSEWEKSIRIVQVLVDLLPQSTGIRSALADLRTRHGDALLRQNEWGQARQAYSQSTEIWQRLCQTAQEDQRVQAGLAQTWLKQCQAYIHSGDLSGAHDAACHALVVSKSNPDLGAQVLSLFGAYQAKQRSADHWENAEQAAEILVDLFPEDVKVYVQLAELAAQEGLVHQQIAFSYPRRHDLSEKNTKLEHAASRFERAIRHYQDLRQRFPNESVTSRMISIWGSLNEIYRELRQFQLADRAVAQVIEALMSSTNAKD